MDGNFGVQSASTATSEAADGYLDTTRYLVLSADAPSVETIDDVSSLGGSLDRVLAGLPSVAPAAPTSVIGAVDLLGGVDFSEAPATSAANAAASLSVSSDAALSVHPPSVATETGSTVSDAADLSIAVRLPTEARSDLARGRNRLGEGLPEPVRAISVRRPARRRVRGTAWIPTYLFQLVCADILAAVLAVTLASMVRLPDGVAAPILGRISLPVIVLLPLAWILALTVTDTYDRRILGLGPQEYQRTARAFGTLMATIGFGSYALQVGVARTVVLVALPATALLSMVGRVIVRRRLHRARTAGTVRSSVIAVGDVDSVIDLAERIHQETYIGMHVVGACVPREELADAHAVARLTEAHVTPLGDLDSVLTAVRRAKIDLVAVASSPAVSPKRLRELSWQLEAGDADLVVAPGLMEVAGPRLHIRPVLGLPLLQIEKPEFSGGRRVVKGFADRLAAALGIVLLMPLLIALWAAVRATSTGPAFFAQTRVGKNGKEFRMWKFRSMYINAEQEKAEYADLNDNDSVLFKIRDDPRVTAVGRVIRRYSLDELPQLFNVITGTMSLVGPRPPLPEEVQQYASHVHRRLLVRPGLTGLWQISGRSDLSWEESVRLDLRYVENWSLGWDAQILWKTASAVLRGSGAY